MSLPEWGTLERIESGTIFIYLFPGTVDGATLTGLPWEWDELKKGRLKSLPPSQGGSCFLIGDGFPTVSYLLKNRPSWAASDVYILVSVGALYGLPSPRCEIRRSPDDCDDPRLAPHHMAMRVFSDRTEKPRLVAFLQGHLRKDIEAATLTELLRRIGEMSTSIDVAEPLEHLAAAMNGLTDAANTIPKQFPTPVNVNAVLQDSATRLSTFNVEFDRLASTLAERTDFVYSGMAEILDFLETNGEARVPGSELLQAAIDAGESARGAISGCGELRVSISGFGQVPYVGEATEPIVVALDSIVRSLRQFDAIGRRAAAIKKLDS